MRPQVRVPSIVIERKVFHAFARGGLILARYPTSPAPFFKAQAMVRVLPLIKERIRQFASN
jgi:hypothetical protein